MMDLHVPRIVYTNRWLTTALLAVAGLVLLYSLHHTGVPDRKEVGWLEHLANNGNTDAQLQLGLAYKEGRYRLKPDPLTSEQWLRRAAKGGNAYAADALAQEYAHEHHTRLAEKWWLAGAQRGNADAQRHLGEQLLSESEQQQALHWLRAAADRGDRQAKADLIELYREGDATGKDLHRGDSPIEALNARLGNTASNALFKLWDTVEADSPFEQSAEELMARADAGDPDAEYQLGLHYLDGAWAVERNPAKARYWLQRAADAGNSLAKQSLKQTPAD
jgi:uncharacterized protein